MSAGPQTTAVEVSVAGLLHDIGKLIQRAHGGRGLPPTLRDRAQDVLPQHQGRYSHWHALWTDLFFEFCGGEGADALPWPAALDRARVRSLAVYHHAPLQDYRTAPELLLSELVTRADRLAAGQERKRRDAEAAAGSEAGDGDRDRRAYLDTALKAIVSSIRLAAGTDEAFWHPPAVAEPNTVLPVRRPASAAMDDGYRAVWTAFRAGWCDLCALAGKDAAGFEEGLLSLSERMLWSVPSSTVDEPDVSLHDHARAVAAFAAALFRFHAAAGTLGDAARLRDGATPAFRFLVGDLSGLQRTLFRLRSEGVPSLAKLLRGRSLRFQLIADAATRRALDAFDMPMSAALQVAGGRFLLLVPDLPDSARRLDALRAEADAWFAEAYTGDLALGLALSAPFAPWDLMPRPDEGDPAAALARARVVRDAVAVAIETAKLRQLEGPASAAVLPVSYPSGDCPACGLRPARGTAEAPEPCPSCGAEIETGRRLPRARAVAIGTEASWTDRLLGLDYLLPIGEGRASGPVARGWRWLRQCPDIGPAAGRPGPAWVARFGDGDDQRYERLASDAGFALAGAGEIAEGEIKTFECLALDALERDGQGRPLGRPMLALVKGDVDRLGEIFAHGLGERWSVARSAQLSRLLDGYFRLRLPHLLETRFAESYTVYAGGDDFVLVLPWRQGFDLAVALAEDFRGFAGGNPDLTFSLGIALFEPRTPISIAAREAEVRLEAAKKGGRNRVSAIAPEPMPWEAFGAALVAAEGLNGWLRDGTLATAALYRLLALDDARRRIGAGKAQPADFAWMGRLGYHLARLRRARGETKKIPPEVPDTLRALFDIGPDWRPVGPPPPGARLAITHALYRNR